MNMNATLLGQAIAFILFVWFCMKFVWPPLVKAIEKRQKEIADGLNAAEEAKKDLAKVQASNEVVMAEAKLEASKLIDKANKRKELILEEAKIEAEREKLQILTQARAQIESERQQALVQLRQQVSSLALLGAEKIIERSIDDEAVNNEMIDKLVAKL